MQTEIQTRLRLMTLDDVLLVCDIENTCFPVPWSRKEIKRVLEAPRHFGIVADRFTHKGTEVIGYMFYTVSRAKFELLNLAVDPRFHRNGVGTTLIEYLKNKVKLGNRPNRITLEISETNLVGQLFLKSLGFKATRVLHEHYDSQDAYHMEFDNDSGR